MKYLVILAGMALVFPCVAQTFTPRVNFPGAARFGAVQFSINDEVYVGLGEAGAGNYPKDFHRYNPTTNQWTAIANFPGAGRETGIAFALNGKGYVGLGAAFTSTSTTVFNDLWRYDPASNSWAQLTGFDGGGRSKAAVFVLNGAAYVGTGSDDQFTLQADWWKYNAGSDSWTLQSSLGNLQPRYGAVACVVANKAYLAGGHGNGTTIFSEIQEFNPASGAGNGWVLKTTDAADLPFVDAAAFVVNNKAYFCYGLNANFITRYDPAINAVTNLGDLLELGEPRRYAPVACATSDGTGYFGLGYAGIAAGQAASYRKDLWQFNPLPTAVSEAVTAPPVGVRVQPRVSGGIFSIVMEQASAIQKTNLLVLNTQGIVLQSFSNLIDDTLLDLSAFAPGVYLLRFQAGKQAWTERIIKQ